MKLPRPNWAKIRDALWVRSGGYCEVSGVRLDPDTFDAHHRRLKGMGGTTRPDRDALSNLLAVDPIVHNGGQRSIHGAPWWARDHGFLVPQHVQVVRNAPVHLRRKTWMYLGDDGRYYPPKDDSPRSD